VYFQFIGKFTLPQEEHIPTEEELASQEKLREKRAKQREANNRWYAKKREEVKLQQAIERGEIEPPTAEELETAVTDLTPLLGRKEPLALRCAGLPQAVVAKVRGDTNITILEEN
jgi:hypothetical protein